MRGGMQMNVPHTNKDFVFKDALMLFKDKTLDFLGLTDIAPLGESLNTETVDIEVTWEFQDLAFSTQDGRGIHFEEEVNLSKDDLLRIGGYNISLSRVHKREFDTIIFLKNPTVQTELKTRQIHFTPIIVQCSKVNADEILDGLKNDIATGKTINELSLIYLPLFSSTKLNPAELFMESAKLIHDMQADDNHKKKIYALLITLMGKEVDQVEMEALAKEVAKMGNTVIEYFEEKGRKRGVEDNKEETARKMLAKGMDTLDVIDVTGLSTERIRKIRESMSNESLANKAM